MNDIDQPIKDLVLPRPHIEANLVQANETYMLAARGTWKTSRGLALYYTRVIYEMPRHTSSLTGLSFEHLGDNTLPPLLQAWDEFGFQHGVHYVVGQRPPKDWPRPLLGLVNEKYDHVISWHNGTVIRMISLAKRASANGISAQSGGFDEVKFMKQKELQDEIFPIFRGNEKHFSHCSGYLSKFFATDKLADPAMIKWLLEKKNLDDPRKNQVVMSLALQLNALKQQYNTMGITAKQKLKPQIHAIEVRLAKLRANMVHYVEISAYDVLYAYGQRWLDDKRRNMKDYEFGISIENLNPDKPGESFYPNFDQALHTYESDYDVDPTKPFIISLDYQHSVVPIPIAQLGKLPNHSKVTLNYVDEVYTLAPKGLAEAVQAFCDKYAHHPRKVVYYVFDHTAVGKRVDADAYYVIVTNILRKNRWAVQEIFTGQAPGHFQKYTDTRAWLEPGEDGPDIMINRKRCKKLVISITGAAARTKNGKTEKVKNVEQEAGLDQSETTHFSDAFDMINDAVLKQKRIQSVTEVRRASAR